MSDKYNPISQRNLRTPKKGTSGRKPGSPNRSTVARRVLALSIDLPESLFEKLKEHFPTIKRRQTIEFAMALMQAKKAIMTGDTQAYKALMDSAYGSPLVQIEDKTERSDVIEIEIIESKPLTNESSNQQG